MNLGLGSKRKQGKVIDIGYPTGLLAEKAKKVWWMAKGGGKWTCLWSKNEIKRGVLGTTQMRTSRSRFPVPT